MFESTNLVSNMLLISDQCDNDCTSCTSQSSVKLFRINIAFYGICISIIDNDVSCKHHSTMSCVGANDLVTVMFMTDRIFVSVMLRYSGQKEAMVH